MVTNQNRFYTMILIGVFLLIGGLDPQAALATQSHGGKEGLHAHQIAHLFFFGSMALLMFWLKAKKLENQVGWYSIRLAALFFMLWNADAFIVHFLETTPELIQVFQPSPWEIHLEASPGYHWLAAVYYLAKLDHLLSLPAMVFLYVGLRKLHDRSSIRQQGEDAG